MLPFHQTYFSTGYGFFIGVVNEKVKKAKEDT